MGYKIYLQGTMTAMAICHNFRPMHYLEVLVKIMSKLSHFTPRRAGIR